jgi:hypothetical protein
MRGGSRSGVVVRRSERAVADGYESPLVPGITASDDARRLAGELTFAAGRLAELATDPPGLYAEAASAADPEEGIWLAFLIAYLGPLEAEDPWEQIDSARVSWASGEPPAIGAEPELGARSAHDPARPTATIEAYRAWAQRAGGQAAALAGEPSWTPERRFDRGFDRLALPGLRRAARFDFLVVLGRLGLAETQAGSLQLSMADEVNVAAKRVFGIGDPILLERRAADLAAEAGVPMAALDLALYNWNGGADERVRLGASPDVEAGGADIESALSV